MRQNGVVEIQQSFSLSDPDGDRRERLGYREHITPVVGDPPVRYRCVSVPPYVQAFEAEIAFRYCLTQSRHTLPD